jgi:hypothetical protein
VDVVQRRAAQRATGVAILVTVGAVARIASCSRQVPDLPDGRTYAYAVAFTGGTLTVDAVRYDAGRVRNDDRRLRTLIVAGDVRIVVRELPPDGDASEEVAITPARYAGYFASARAQQYLYALTLAHGVVTEIHEEAEK